MVTYNYSYNIPNIFNNSVYSFIKYIILTNIWGANFQNAFCLKFIIFRKWERKPQGNYTFYKKYVNC